MVEYGKKKIQKRYLLQRFLVFAFLCVSWQRSFECSGACVLNQSLGGKRSGSGSGWNQPFVIKINCDYQQKTENSLENKKPSWEKLKNE